MCGIFTILNGNVSDNSPYWDNMGRLINENYSVTTNTKFASDRISYSELYTLFLKGKGRGPESSKLIRMGMRVIMGFHRLAINGLITCEDKSSTSASLSIPRTLTLLRNSRVLTNPESDQPISMDDIHLICNGEIYNYKELYELMGVEPTTQSDCEVIIHLYKKYGMEHTLRLLDGVFALVLLDQSLSVETPLLYVARDPYGICPLYINDYTDNNPIMISSELKMMYSEKSQHIDPRHVSPGTYSEFYLTSGVSPTWKIKQKDVVYFVPGITFQQYPDIAPKYYDLVELHKQLRDTFIRAVEKRCECTERPIACLLSGGLDSSLVASIVSNYMAKRNLPQIETYSIGLEGSEDIRNAKIVADYLGTTHHEVVVTEQTFLDAIPDVIYAIESYDTTTVRSSIGNYLIAKYIAEHSDAKVIFNGDGADELMGGYLYMRACPDAIEHDCETRRLLKEIHAFDVLRSNKSVSTNGLEPRTPFLDREFTQTYLNIPAKIRFETTVVEEGHPFVKDTYIEKRLIRDAFRYVADDPTTHRSDGRAFLPDEILWRKKEAFSDGVSKQCRSLFEIIQEHTTAIDMSRIRHIWRNAPNVPRTSEQLYYRSIFERHFPHAQVVPHFWMPKYIASTDASARTLSIYKRPDRIQNDIAIHREPKRVSFSGM